MDEQVGHVAHRLSVTMTRYPLQSCALHPRSDSGRLDLRPLKHFDRRSSLILDFLPALQLAPATAARSRP
jgi:hypothetical protein